MFRLLFVTISLISLSATAATPDSLEQINADLLAKKAKEEPFRDKDIKIDLESLGLDDLDARENKAKKVTDPVKKIENPSAVKASEKAETVNVTNPQNNSEKLEKSQLLPPETVKKDSQSSVKPIGIFDKMKELSKNAESKIKQEVEKQPKANTEAKPKQTFIQKDLSTTKVEQEKKTEAKSTDVKASSEAKKNLYVNSTKQKNLKKYEAKKKLEKSKAEANEKKRKNNLEKLNRLRQKYLLKIDKNQIHQEQSQNKDDDFEEVDQTIIPKRRNINKFSSYETPAPPILNRFRSHDNQNIPIILSNGEKTDILFRSIGQSDISYFNSAFSDIENPNLRNDFGDTILTYSILMQKRDVVASILAKGADPDLANNLGYTPLQITIELLDLASFNLLVNANANVNYVDGFGRTHLMHAARMGFLQAIDILIKKGADINALDQDGFTALAIAQKYKQELAVALLLKNGAKPWVEKPYDPESESIMNQLNSRWKK